MATSSSVQTGSYDGRYLKLSVWEDSFSTSGNYSVVKWKIESIGGSVNYYSIYKWGVWVNNSEKYGLQTTSYTTHAFPAATGSDEGSITVYHNSDGTASNVPFTLKGRVYYNYDDSVASDYTFNGSISLTRIYRTPSYNSINASDISEFSVKLTASIDTKTLSITGGGWDLSTDEGATWTYYSGGPTSKTITGLNPGTKYWYRGYVETSGGHANSSWSNFTTKDCVFKEKISGTWKSCVPYIKVNGTWKKAIPYIKVNGSWKEGIN